MRIELLGLTKHYGAARPLNDLTLTIEPGQIIALVGVNGAGKTTLLRCLSGIVIPNRGKILYGDQVFKRDRIDLRERFMFLPDFPLVFGEMTVLKHIAMLLRLYKRDDAGIEQRIIEYLRELDLLPLIDKPMSTMSRGQIYKSALAGLLAVDPEVWLLDEPFASGMDPHGISFFKREARAAAGRGRTVIYSTQILDVAENLSDQVCIIDKGEMRICAPVAELKSQGSMAVPGGILEDVFQRMREERE